MRRAPQTAWTDLAGFDLARSRGLAAPLAGVDEAGRGALAGPVVAAAVIIEPGEGLREVRDSKELPEAVRERLYESIVERSVSWATGIVAHDEIDRVNILQATLQAMRIAIEGLGEIPGLVLVDGTAAPPVSCQCETVTGGDRRSFSIAAASIVAKVTRDRIMRELGGEYPSYGFTRNKGYGTAGHRHALERFGPSPVHRRTFRVRAKA
jgi:ribonuclease HII